jgi:hypothetical protein
MRGRSFARGLACCLLMLASSLAAKGQELIVTGRVVDASGSGVPEATVSATGAARAEARCDRAGRFRLSLPAGTYVLLVEKAGFVPQVLEVFEARADLPEMLLRLELARSEDLTVQERTGLALGASDNATGVVLKDSLLEALPDDPDELAAALQALAGPAAGPNGGQLFVDGFTGGRIPNKNAIREIRLNANPFSAEYDRIGFGRIEIFTRPGTERWRGELGARFNDARLNTRNPFAPNRAPYQRLEGNLELSGPLARDKATLYIEAEHRRSDENDTVNALVLDEQLASMPFARTFTRPGRRTSFSPRVDWQMTRRHSLSLRYSESHNTRAGNGVGGFNLPTRAFETDNTERALQATETALFAGFVHELRLRYTWSSRTQSADLRAPALLVAEAFASGGAPIGQARALQRRLELADVLSLQRGRHALRAGLRLRRNALSETSFNNFAGVVTFAGGNGPLLDPNDAPVLAPNGRPVRVRLSSLERYRRTLALQARGLSPARIRALGGGPTQLLIAGGNPDSTATQWDGALFLQDDFTVSPRLALGLGLRAEAQTGVAGGLDLAPRASLAWTARQAADGRTPVTVLRAGLGRFYERVSEDLSLDVDGYRPGGRVQYLVTDPAVLDLVRVDANGVSALPSLATLDVFALPRNTRVLADDLRAPSAWQSSISIEQRLFGRLTVSSALVYTRGQHQLRSRVLPVSETGAAGGAAVFAYESTGRARQVQLVTGLASTPHRRYSFFARYFVGWTRNDTDGPGSFPARSTELAAEYGRASSDTRHRLVLGGSVETLWGLRINPFLLVSSGRPFNITVGRDLDGDRQFTDRPAFGDDGGDVLATAYGLLDLSPGAGALIPRNYGTGPGYASLTLRISKTIPWKRQRGATPRDLPAGGDGPGGAGSRWGFGGGGRGPGGGRGAPVGPGLTFSLNVSNVFNHVNAGTPVGNLSSPLFGQSTSLASAFGGFGPGGGGGAGGASGDGGNRRLELQVRAAF